MFTNVKERPVASSDLSLWQPRGPRRTGLLVGEAELRAQHRRRGRRSTCVVSLRP